MAAESPADRAAAVRSAIADADVGRSECFVPLSELDGIGDVAVVDGTARIEVTLPVPAAAVRERLEGALADAARSVSDVSRVDVEWRSDPAEPDARVDFLPDVEHVVAVASGKGGVGKSTVAVNLAVSLADAGASVGLLDADIYGPNAPAMLGHRDATPRTDREARIHPPEAHGVTVMSMGYVVGEDDPVIWRGAMVDDALQQLFGDVAWGSLDYLVVDLPPGTGDAQLSLVQHLPVTGAVVVTTPQSVAVDDARRGLRQFAKYGVPVLGVVENMSRFECPDCGGSHDLFGSGGGEELAGEFEIPLLGQIPLDRAAGTIETTSEETARGVTIPLVGRLQLPRSSAERGGTSLPPVALRDDGGELRDVFRTVAGRVAARLQALVVSGETRSP
ncbi:P-loop NTPase [Haloarchaeobius sp. HRN-SO-5]|uniref:Mrp/NBP35 family ATP-binding protein n=1 Tax=Haloarchaeobius sp. HRN-SO-5 TaxID=3446118 RepID=UPI003EB8CF04